jgi:hypothetical protein
MPGPDPKIKDEEKAKGKPAGTPDVTGSGNTRAPTTTPPMPVTPAPKTRAQLAQTPVSNAIRAERSRRAAAAIRARSVPPMGPGLVRDYEMLEGLIEDVAELFMYPTPRQVRAALDEVVELKGKPRLDVSDLHRELIVDYSPSVFMVDVRFGQIARGTILVAADQDGQLYSPVDAVIPFQHPDLPPLEAPWLLALGITQNLVFGYLAADQGGQDMIPINGRNAQRFLGLEDLQDLQPGAFHNKLLAGVLDFGYPSMKYFFDGLFTGSGMLLVRDDNPVTFAAKADVETEGVKKQEVSIVRNVLGALGAKADLSASYATPEGDKLGGQLTARFDRGVVDIRGTLKYEGGAAKGEVTVMIADQETAWAAVRQRLGDKAPPVIEKKDSPNGLAFIGWGALDFSVNEWLTGNAAVVLDPDGYVTAMGSLRPTKVLTFFDQRKRGPTNVIPPEKFSIWIPKIGVRLGLTLTLTKTYWVGPGTLSQIEVDGVFSTRPHTPAEFRVSGLFLIPAHADLELGIIGDATFLGIAGVTGKIAGIAALDAQAFARPHIGRRRHASDPSKASFHVGGYLGAEAALSLGFSGKIGVIVKMPLFIPNITWYPLDTGPRLWRLGTARVSVQGDYVLGEKKDPRAFDYQMPELNTEYLKSALMRQDLSPFEEGTSRTSDVKTRWLDAVSAAEVPKAESIEPASNQPSEIEPTPTIAMPEIPSHPAAAVLPPPPAGASGAPATTTTVPGEKGPDTPPPPAAPPGPTLAPGATKPPPSEPDPTLAPGLPPIVAPFMMLDTPHTLYLVREAKPYIVMASAQFDRLKTDLTIAMNVIGQEIRNSVGGITREDPTDPTRAARTVKELEEELKALEDLHNSCDGVERRAWREVWEAPTGHVGAFEGLIAQLSAYATLFDRRDLIRDIRNLPTRVVPRAPGQVSSGRRITAFQSLLDGDPARAVRLQSDYEEYERDRRSQSLKVMQRASYLEMRARFILGYEAERPSISLYTLETGLNVEKNSRTVYPTMPDDPKQPRRIPDIYVPGLVIADIKNVGTQRLTSQMIDDAAIADLKPGDFFWDEKQTQKITQTTGRFDLVVRAPWHERGSTNVHDDVKTLVTRRHGKIYKLIEDPGEPEHAE